MSPCAHRGCLHRQSFRISPLAVASYGSVRALASVCRSRASRPMQYPTRPSPRSLAVSRELGPNGINVNLVQHGSVNTESNPTDGSAADFQRSLTSLGRSAEPQEIVDTAIIPASPAASAITGSILRVDAGAIT